MLSYVCLTKRTNGRELRWVFPRSRASGHDDTPMVLPLPLTARRYRSRVAVSFWRWSQCRGPGIRGSPPSHFWNSAGRTVVGRSTSNVDRGEEGLGESEEKGFSSSGAEGPLGSPIFEFSLQLESPLPDSPLLLDSPLLVIPGETLLWTLVRPCSCEMRPCSPLLGLTGETLLVLTMYLVFPRFLFSWS
jgi:hypothetical protein